MLYVFCCFVNAFMFSFSSLACSVSRRATLSIPCNPDVYQYVNVCFQSWERVAACCQIGQSRSSSVPPSALFRLTKTPKATPPLPLLLVAIRVQGLRSHRKTNTTNRRNALVLIVFISKSFKRTARKHVRQLYVQRWPPTPSTCSPLSNLSSSYTFGIFRIPSTPPPLDTSRRPNEIP